MLAKKKKTKILNIVVNLLTINIIACFKIKLTINLKLTFYPLSLYTKYRNTYKITL